LFISLIALEAAALAWATVSGMSFGPWAQPLENIRDSLGPIAGPQAHRQNNKIKLGFDYPASQGVLDFQGDTAAAVGIGIDFRDPSPDELDAGVLCSLIVLFETLAIGPEIRIENVDVPLRIGSFEQLRELGSIHAADSRAVLVADLLVS
jgi:hypothetical protein